MPCRCHCAHTNQHFGEPLVLPQSTPTPKAAMPSALPPIGSRVIVCNLRSRPALNGQGALVLSHNVAKGRCGVLVDGEAAALSLASATLVPQPLTEEALERPRRLPAVVAPAMSSGDLVLDEMVQLLSDGEIKWRQGDTEGALRFFEHVRVCGQRIRDDKQRLEVVEMAIGNLGNVHRGLGKYDTAITHLLQALQISRELCDEKGEEIHLGNLGNAYESLGQYECAIKHHMKARAISHRCQDREGEALHLGNLGSSYRKLGQYERAVEYYTKALEISRGLGDRQAEGALLGRLGNACHCQGKYDTAMNHLSHALEISRDCGNRRDEMGHLEALGIIYTRKQQYDSAIKHHTQALAISRAISDQRSSGNQLAGLAKAYCQQGQYERAVGYFEQALEISHAIGDRLGESIDLANLGLTYLEKLDDPAAALPWLQQSCESFDALWTGLATDERRISYGDTFSVVARHLQYALARLEQAETALEAAERARSRSFEVLLAQQRVARSAAAAAPSISNTVVPLRYDALLKVANRQKVTIVVFSQIDASRLLVWVVRGSGPLAMRPLHVASQDKSLTRLVELTRRTIGASPRHSETPARPSGSERFVAHEALAPLNLDEAALDGASRRDLATLDDGGDESQSSPEGAFAADEPLRALLRHCYELLIAPLGLVDREALLLVPDRDLYALPFAALLDPDGKHLIETHSLRVAPSLGTVIELEARAGNRMPARGRGLVVGNPTFHGWAPQLPGAETEARHVADALTNSAGCKDAVRVLVGGEATKRAVVEEMRGCEFIHLSTHGEPDCVVLGGPTRAEGTLTMAEVQALELSARLVVLSECDSFLGKLTSDGVVGITRAFVAAGALTLVASLWKVDDSTTAELMQHFYTRLLASGTAGDVATAMQGAMVSMIGEGCRCSVHGWAAFVVYGL